MLAPALPGFHLNRNDVRPLGDPIDMIVFEGLSKRGRVERILFADVKSGNARLSVRQRSIRQSIERKRVEFHTYGR
jgi:predicted Holliday junction resolvase-like endonuclease